MKCVLQRVARAEVRVAGEVVGSIESGLLALVCALEGDGGAQAVQLAEKVARYRVFEDETGRMNRSVMDIGAAVLVVSQFTLAADGRRGRRPSFDSALKPEAALPLVERFRATLEALGVSTASGRFGAYMDVELLNSGPATFVLEISGPGS